MIWRYRFVHSVPARTSSVAVRVAVHAGSATGTRNAALGVGQGMTEVGVGLSQRTPTVSSAKASQVCPPARWQRTSKELVRHCSATLDAQNIVGRHFKPLLKRAGLPDIRWHDLRHTYATLLLARGTHPTYVQ